MRKKPPPNTEPLPPPSGFDGTGVRLTPGQYWKWRLTIEEMQHAGTKRDLRKCECKYKELEIQKESLQLILLNNKFQEQVSAVDASKIEYDKVKVEIELELGISLSNCVIDEHTWEVKKLPETSPKQKGEPLGTG